MRARLACVALVALAVAEYAVSPPALWRDVLPTAAHRWVMQQPVASRVLDCTPLDQESASVQWLTGDRVALPTARSSDCAEPTWRQKLAADGYTHLLVRRDTAERPMARATPGAPTACVRPRASTTDVFAVDGANAGVYTPAMTGFFPREHDAESDVAMDGRPTRRGRSSTPAPQPIVATLDLELAAFHVSRAAEAARSTGGRCRRSIVEPSRRVYRLGPLTLDARRARAHVSSGRSRRRSPTR